MLCPVCKVEMCIQSGKHVLKTVEGEQKLYMRQEMACRNPQCTNHKKVVETVDNELQLLKE